MRLSKSLIPLVAGLSVLSTPALAQTVPEHGVFILNSLLFLLAGFWSCSWPAAFVCLKQGWSGQEHHNTIDQEYRAVFDCGCRLLPCWL